MAQLGPVTIDAAHRVVLFNLRNSFRPGMSDVDLYEATRKWWRVDPRRCDLGKPWAPERAMAVFGGVVQAVYAIDTWEPPTDDDIAGIPARIGRWSFRGTRDRDMERQYIDRDVSPYLRSAGGGPTQNPVRYVNCAPIGRSTR